MTNSNAVEKGLYFALFLLYVGLAFLFSSFSPQAQIVSLWPSAGVGLAGLWVLKGRFLPAIFFGSFLFHTGVQYWDSDSFSGLLILKSGLIATIVSLQLWINYRVIQHLNVKILKSPTHTQVFRFIYISLLCPLLSALVGNAVLTLSSDLHAGTPFEWSNVAVWWIGHFLGTILVTPLLVSLLKKDKAILEQLSFVRGIAIPLFSILLVFQAAQQYVETLVVKNTLKDFTLKSKVAENSLKQQMDRYIEGLDLLDLAFSKETHVSKEEFASWVASLRQDLPGIKAMSWNPVVQPTELDAFKEYSRQHIDPNFTVKGEPLLATDPLVVVQLIEPLEQNRAAQGFNVYSNPIRKESMLYSKYNQAAAASNILQLVQSENDEPGFLIFSPVFRSVGSDEESLSNPQFLSGFVVGVFLVSEIIEQTFEDELIKFIDIYIYENNNPADKVYGNESIFKAMLNNLGQNYVFDFSFAGHYWTFNLHIDETYVLNTQVQSSLSFLFTEAVFGMLAVFVILTAFGRQEKLRFLVNQRTKELKEANTELENYAFYDSLTALPNRRFFTDLLELALARAEQEESTLAVIFMDLNRFKQVNDGLGHECGDQMLKEVALRFNQVIKGQHVLARIGGDEFTLLIEGDPTKEQIVDLGQELLASLQKPIDVSGRLLMTSASAGVAVYPKDGTGLADLMRGADTAMYHAKHSGLELCFYSEQLLSKVSQQLFLDTELPHALAKNELQLYYQPIVDLTSLKSIGAEALLRWNHPTSGLISPAHFIPAAEASGEIVPIGYWVVEQACETLARWCERHPAFQKISVNVSARQLQEDNFFAVVKEIIERHAVAPERLQFEVTETSLMRNATQAIQALSKLKALGVKIAIDDYGTGYSSLRYLKMLPVDVLKLDRAFIQGMGSQSHDFAIVKSTIYLANELGIQVIAEGIEKQSQVDILQSIQCEMGQGFLFSKPIPEKEYLATLEL
jgi:diguanylate cyclase (GGDEF)-like protein